MNDDLTPDDPFGERLAARMHGAADPLEGTGVTRRGVVAAAVERRRRQVRNRGLAVGVTACVAVLGGLALLGRSTDDGTQHLASGPTTTSASSSTSTTTSAVAGGNTATTTTVDPRRPDGAPEQIDASTIRERDLLWAVYVDTWTVPRANSGIATTTTPDGHNSVTSGEDRWWAAETRVSEVGYQGMLTELACEQPLSTEGSIPPAVGGFQNWAVAVYFTSEVEARAFAELLPGTEAAISHIRFTCSG